MFLRSIDIENFRGIRQASIQLDQTTILIGENDCGKSSILESLAIALGTGGEGAPHFNPYHFYRNTAREFHPAGPIRLRFLFEEREPGEWSSQEYAPIQHILSHGPKDSRQLALVMTAQAGNGESDVGGDWWMEDSKGHQHGLNEPETLAYIRRMNPLIWLPGGVVTPGEPGHQTADNARNGSSDDRTEHLISLVETQYKRVLEGTSFDLVGDLQAGFEAARDLLRTRKHFGTVNPRSAVEEITGRLSSRKGTDLGQSLRFHGSAAQRIGVLLLTGALLRAGERGIAEFAEPLVVIEDPETHLHPMTRASVWNVVEHIGWQKILTTHSGHLLSEAPLPSIRRLTRTQGLVRQWRIQEGRLSREELRKFSYHVRVRHNVASFARCWLLVEGETEFWVLPELARLCGYDFSVEGIECVEFAQSGVVPLVKVARDFGIEWHMLTDGDAAGRAYVRTLREHVPVHRPSRFLTILREQDIEHLFWKHGYAHVYREQSKLPEKAQRRMPPGRIIERAIERTSKPFLAIEVLEAIGDSRGPGVPGPLQRVVETCVRLAREAPGSRSGTSPQRENPQDTRL